ncbi:MAG: hypothetical protein H6Q74_329 [Firmicutes bacterium]|nr:hypothetical protein [Bacillota bacterium]
MKPLLWSFTIVLTAVVFSSSFALCHKAFAAENSSIKKAILVVSFGTTYAETRKATTDD